MKDTAQTEYAPRIMINSQIGSYPEHADQKNCFRILHVDDDFDILDVSKKILEIEGKFEVDTALSVDEAFQKMGQKKYDAVISDYEMQRQNGIAFLRLLREQQNNIPFILFTGKGREDVAIEALNLGSDAYINKMGNPETVYGELSDALVKTIERKQSKRLLAESELNYRRLVENSLQGIVIAQGFPLRLVFANPEIGKFTGYSPGELVALSSEEITRLIHPDDREAFLNRFIQRLTGKGTEFIYEFRGIRKDGSIRWLEVYTNRIEYNGQPALQAMFLDITERKKAEEKLVKLMNELATVNEKLHMVGSVTRHDVRNKLSVVTGNLYLLRKRVANDDKMLEQLNQINGAVHQVERIFEFAKIYEQIGSEQLADMDVGKAVDEATSLFSDLKGVKVVNECRGLMVLADSLLRQLFYNLIDNSLKYGEKIKRIQIRSEQEGDVLRVVYEDDGVGIPGDMRSKLFQEDGGKGSGYGLFMIKRICEAYGWIIQETSRQGEGAQFTITTPKINEV